ncbi:lipocalin-like domain-containing protein [Derxia gummosa]|uniref:Lipocalin-like domain-containing protein n=1 Tax=Derxia gummosa DSM 723 TaxID=1121388 RepID=A0A8B6X8P1_9BURK|nr:lipocalin-like domain-containing protein [Derxia gummosa]
MPGIPVHRSDSSAPPHAGRRRACGLLIAGAATLAPAAGPATTAAEPPFAEPRRGQPLVFPRDHGAHSGFRTEWWYLTGWLDAERDPLGFQITFFRSRLDVGANAASRFAPRQVVFTHVALSDPALGHALHDDRALRAGFRDAIADDTDARLVLGDWTLARDAASGHWRARLPARDFALDLDFAPTQPVMLQGDAGWSQKSPAQPGRPIPASHYYSLPALAVTGSVTRDGRARDVAGRAWLDREWSSQYLAADAAGWDWLALNLDDGGALMAFRMRRKGAPDAPPLWQHAGLRATPDGPVTDPGPPRLTPLRWWTSPRSGARYPVAMTLMVGGRRLVIEPLMDDQELDSRRSTGTIYWEGAVRATEDGRRVGLGYLELTGYSGQLSV